MAFGALFGLAYLAMRWLPLCIGAVLALRARRHCPRGPGMIALAFLMMLASELLPLFLSVFAFSANTVAVGPNGQPVDPGFDWAMLLGIAMAVMVALLTIGSWVLLLMGIFSRRVGMLGYLASQHAMIEES